MAMIEFWEGAIQVDAKLIAEGLEIDVGLVQDEMRDGRITSRHERGIDEDEGRHRLTFFTQNRRLRLIVDETGNVIRRSSLNFSDDSLPASARRLG